MTEYVNAPEQQQMLLCHSTNFFQNIAILQSFTVMNSSSVVVRST